MKILVITCYPPEVGGGELQTQLQVRELVKRGHEVIVIDARARYTKDVADHDGPIPVIRIVTPGLPIIRSMVYHTKITWHTFRQGRGASVAHINNIGTALACSVPTLGLMGIPRALVIWGSARAEDKAFGPGWRNVLSRQVARRVERIVALATSSIDNLTKRRFPRERISFIPNGVDTDKFRPPGPGEPKVRPAGWPSGGPVVISVGRLFGIKGFDLLLTAWAKVLRHHPEAHLVIAGDGSIRESLLAQAATLGIVGRVTLLGQRDDVPELLRAADIYVSSSRSEGMSNAILEALASGLPVVATRAGAEDDIIDDGVTGLLIPTENAAAIASGLTALLDDPARRRDMAQRARARVLADFQVSAVVERYLRLYQELSST
jgi:glycosyltransferase involved in cell wall biosynthesis